MTTDSIRSALLAVMRQKTGARIRLPTSLTLSGTPDALHMQLDAPAVISNMQSDAGAFDAWALAFWSWTEVKRITLSWTPPTDPARDGHYQRFLFRLRTMLRLFPERFLLGNGMDAQRDAQPFNTINVCDQNRSARRRPTEGEAAIEWDLAQAKTERGAALREQDHLCDVCPQLPVGIFQDVVSERAAVFTGKKSAIDLVGWDGDGGFHLYELKDSGNAKLGIVSELLFYVAIILEMRDGRVQPKHRSGKAPDDSVYRQIAACKRVTGTYLAPDFHPLLIPDARLDKDDGACSPIISMLNQAFRERVAVPVSFRARRLKV